MSAITFNNFDGKILIIGSIFDRICDLSKHPDWFMDNDLIIINGNICYPNDNLENVKDRIDILDKYLQSNKVIYNLGEQDLILMKRLWDNNQLDYNILSWLQNKNNVVIVNFINQTRLVVVSGGLPPETIFKQLHSNLKLSFVSRWGEEAWQSKYSGGIGYVVSNNPLTDAAPKFYNFAAQIGNKYRTNSDVYAIQIHGNGLNKIYKL